MNTVLRYENGLRVAVQYLPSVRSVSMGYWAGVGCSKETPEINGLSHFTEHMMFKGTSRFTPLMIAQEFDAMGTVSNAFTGKELTCYYIKTMDEYAERSFALLSDLIFDSVFPEAELNKERKVIVEEINMVEDAPEDICYDTLAAAVYKDGKLGQTILGSIENVKRFTGRDVREFLKKFYSPSNMVVTVAGGMSADEADRLIRKYCLDRFTADGEATEYEPAAEIASAYRERIKDFEQTNLAVAYPTISLPDERLMRQAYLSLVLGGGMSSRLFQTIREEMGLAYSIYATPTVYKNNGSLNVYVNINPKNTGKVMKQVRCEIEKLVKGGITREEFDRARVQLKSSCIFAFESPQSIMNSLSKPLLLMDKGYDLNDKIAEIEAVTIDEVNEFARRFLVPDRVCAAYVGKKPDTDVLSIMKN